MDRADLVIEERGDGFIMAREKRGEVLRLADLDELRWLAFVALPTLIVAAQAVEDAPAEKASDVPEKVEEQIPGQTTIDDVLEEAVR